MPLERRSFASILERNRADIETRLPGADSRLPFSDLDVLAHVLAQSEYDLSGYIVYLSQQIHPDTAEAAVLARHAAWWGITRKPPVAASGLVTVTGTAGAPIPAGTLLQYAGRDYATDAEVTITVATVDVSVTAAVAGAAGTCPAGAKLAFVSPIGGVQSQAVATAGITGGTDAEADTTLLARLLRRMQAPPHGGSAADYVTWALEVPGVTRAWVAQMIDGAGLPVPGSVWLTFVCDGQVGSIIPDGTTVTAVQTYIDARRPVTAEVTVVAPTPVALDLTISGLDPVTQAVKDAIAAEIIDLLEREAQPGETILLSHIREAISLAAGERDHQLVAPDANVTHARHEIAVMGVITWS